MPNIVMVQRQSSTPSPTIKPNYQGGKVFGMQKKKQEQDLTNINQEFLDDHKYKEVEELPAKLEVIRDKFLEYDEKVCGKLGITDVKRMLEMLGTPRTHLEVKKMISEVNADRDGGVNYREFVRLMLGPQSAVLKLIMLFEKKRYEEEYRPRGPPPKRAIHDLP